MIISTAVLLSPHNLINFKMCAGSVLSESLALSRPATKNTPDVISNTMKSAYMNIFIAGLIFSIIGCTKRQKESHGQINDSIFHNITIPDLNNTTSHKHNLSTEEFSKHWRADTAKNSFRANSLDYDTLTNEIISVNGINFANSDLSRIEYLLGKPDRFVSSPDSLTIDYFLAPQCGFSEEGCYRWVLEIIFEKGLVTNFKTSFINTD